MSIVHSSLHPKILYPKRHPVNPYEYLDQLSLLVLLGSLIGVLHCWVKTLLISARTSMQSPNGIGAILLPHIHKASDRHYPVRKPHGRLCAVGLLCRPFSKRRLVNLPFNCGTKSKDIE